MREGGGVVSGARDKKHSISGPASVRAGGRCWRSDRGGDHGGASPRDSTVAGPRRRYARNRGRNVREAEDETGRARRRVARVTRAIEPIRIPPTPPVVACEKKDPKLRGRARKARRGEARDARTRPARGEKRPSGVVGRCSRGARGSRRPRREPPRGFRRPHRVTSDRSDGREPPSGRARVRFPNRCAPWRRWCGARRARGRGGRGDRRRRWQTS